MNPNRRDEPSSHHRRFDSGVGGMSWSEKEREACGAAGSRGVRNPFLMHNLDAETNDDGGNAGKRGVRNRLLDEKHPEDVHEDAVGPPSYDEAVVSNGRRFGTGLSFAFGFGRDRERERERNGDDEKKEDFKEKEEYDGSGNQEKSWWKSKAVGRGKGLRGKFGWN